MPIFFRLFFPLLAALSLSACSMMLTSATANMAKNLSRAISNNDDLPTVRAGAPAYLLMLDSLIEGDPDNSTLLLAAAKLNSAYAGVFVTDTARARRLTQKALSLSLRANCLQISASCGMQTITFGHFTRLIDNYSAAQLDLLFTLGSSWAGWIQHRSDDWNAVAELPRVKKIMQRILQLDETYQHGQAHLYMGVLNTLLPPSLGGKVKQGQQHFEKAIAISKGKNLLAKVIYAEKYARLVFDQALHDRLLREVLETEPRIPGFTLTNMLAQQQARKLLAGSKDYF